MSRIVIKSTTLCLLLMFGIVATLRYANANSSNDAVSPAFAEAIREAESTYRGFRGNDTRAAAWFRKMAKSNWLEHWEAAAESGMEEAQFLYGMALSNGYGIQKDEEKALGLLRKSAAKGHLPSMAQYGFEIARTDPEKAVAILKQAVDRGNALAARYLGIIYEHGVGVSKSAETGVFWYEKGANLGDLWAQVYFARKLHNGSGIAADKNEALRWFSSAAAGGHESAMAQMGLFLYNGEIVKEDKTAAFNWFRKAAELEHAMSLHFVGLMLFRGEGVSQDRAEAVQWLEKAAELNHRRAKTNLGVIYLNGLGVDKNMKRAHTLLASASEAGCEDATFELAKAYLEGIGVTVNRSRGVAFLKEAIDLGSTEAEELFNTLPEGKSAFWQPPSHWQATESSALRRASYTVPQTDLDIHVIVLNIPSPPQAAHLERLKQQSRIDNPKIETAVQIQAGDHLGKFYRLFGNNKGCLSVVIQKDATSWFFKMVGSEKSVREQEADFIRSIQSADFSN